MNEEDTLLKEYPKDSLPHALRCPHTSATMRPMTCVNCTADELLAVLLELKRSYYVDGIELMGEKQYDQFEAYLWGRFPKDERFKQVGSK